jgi:hypothetical protein
VVYQCKHYDAIEPHDLVAAVTLFLKGVWKNRAKRFVLCTTAATERTQVADEIEKQAARLASAGVEFVVQGRTELAACLKVLPKLVDDFFGREWVRAFCGPEAALMLGERVDGPSLSKLRAELKAFYRRIFALHDPGLPPPDGEARQAPELERRYVVPDVLVSSSAGASSTEQPKAHTALDIRLGPGFRNAGEPRPYERGHSFLPTTRRMPAEHWLMSAGRLLLVGPPGSGKSALLRFIALDLLSDTPQFDALAKRRPDCIPVWVPFAFWTEMFAHQPPGECSLNGFLKSWLASWDAIALYPLIESALTDRRLLLLIDGIDEWRSSDAASVAIQRLLEFVRRHDTPLLCSSRPYGVERAASVDPDLKRAHLAPLTPVQREHLAAFWLLHWVGDSSDLEANQRARKDAGAFATALLGKPALLSLSENPLLLMLLASVWLRDPILPDSRFGAYERLIEHLLREHPRRRATAASFAGDSVRTDPADVRHQLAFIAFRMHETQTYTEARDTLRASLIAQLSQEGFSMETARCEADHLLGQAPDAPPLLGSAQREPQSQTSAGRFAGPSQSWCGCPLAPSPVTVGRLPDLRRERSLESRRAAGGAAQCKGEDQSRT